MKIFSWIKLFWVNRLFALVYSTQDDNAKRSKSQRYYLLKDVIKN